MHYVHIVRIHVGNIRLFTKSNWHNYFDLEKCIYTNNYNISKMCVVF